MELPGASLQKACRLLVVFCALHLSAVLFYYLKGNTLSRQRSPEPPPRSQTFGRRVTETVLSGNISKPAADCPDPSPLLSKCGAPRAPSLSAPWPKSSTLGAPRFSPSPAFASPRGSPQFQPAALSLPFTFRSLAYPLPHRASLLRSPLYAPTLSCSCLFRALPASSQKLLARSLAGWLLFLRDLPAASPFSKGKRRPSAERRSFSEKLGARCPPAFSRLCFADFGRRKKAELPVSTWSIPACSNVCFTI